MSQITKTLILFLGAAVAGTGRVPPSFSLCDVNQDSLTNLVDVGILANQALNIQPPVNDLNGDGVVNISDVQIALIAALGDGCEAGPHTYAIGSVPFSVKNSASPQVAGPQTFAVSGAPVSLLNSMSPQVAGPQTFAVSGAPISLLNSMSPQVAGPQTFAVSGAPISLLNSAPPPVPTPQTFALSSLFLSLFNGPSKPPSSSAAVPTSLHFLTPVDPRFLAQALLRGAQSVNGKTGCQDSDGDGLCDADELIIGTSPYLADTDGDGYPDGLELSLGSDPLDPKSTPDLHPHYFATPPVSIQILDSLASLTPRRQGATYARNVQ